MVESGISLQSCLLTKIVQCPVSLNMVGMTQDAVPFLNVPIVFPASTQHQKLPGCPCVALQVLLLLSPWLYGFFSLPIPWLLLHTDTYLQLTGPNPPCLQSIPNRIPSAHIADFAHALCLGWWLLQFQVSDAKKELNCFFRLSGMQGSCYTHECQAGFSTIALFSRDEC